MNSTNCSYLNKLDWTKTLVDESLGRFNLRKWLIDFQEVRDVSWE